VVFLVVGAAGHAPQLHAPVPCKKPVAALIIPQDSHRTLPLLQHSPFAVSECCSTLMVVGNQSASLAGSSISFPAL
jgi:hypothetical protein